MFIILLFLTVWLGYLFESEKEYDVGWVEIIRYGKE